MAAFHTSGGGCGGRELGRLKGEGGRVAVITQCLVGSGC
jgi:hypothetical protein